MKYDPDRRRQKSTPPAGLDYSHPAVYFVTLSTFQREEIFGSVVDNEMKCSHLGRIVRTEWFRLAESSKEIQLFKSEFVVMPNHIHGIVWIVCIEAVGADPLEGDFGVRPGILSNPVQPDRPLPEWVRSNKTLANNALLNRTRVPGKVRPPHNGGADILASFLTGYKAAVIEHAGEKLPLGSIWQENPPPHIIRNVEDLNELRVYIHTNPLHWLEDKLHPSAQPPYK